MDSKTEEAEAFGERLKDAFAACGLDDEAIAERLGYADRTMVTKWRGGQVPGIGNLARLAKVIGASGHYLLVGTGPVMAAELEIPDEETQLYADAFMQVEKIVNEVKVERAILRGEHDPT